MSALKVLTTVNRCVPMLKDHSHVLVYLDIHLVPMEDLVMVSYACNYTLSRDILPCCSLVEFNIYP